MRLFIFIVMLVAGISAAVAAPGGHAVVLVYHHVSDATPPSTSVSPEQFERHLAFLAENGYRVWPLERTLDAVYDDAGEFPDDVVSITFDDAYESVYSEALPRLAERGWPFTVFVNTDAVDAGHEPYMSWDQLRELAEAGAAIENHSTTHGHLSRPRAGESEQAWRCRVRADIEQARSRIRAEIGRAPSVFAYPYGEDSPALAEIVAKHHEYGLAQRSGPVGPLSDRLSIPRFPMATGFASLDRLELAVRSRPLPVAEVIPRAARKRGSGDLESIRLQLAENGFRAGQLNCFSAGGERLETSIGGDGPGQVGIDVAGIGTPGRNKINCTAPAADGSGDYYWFSHQWMVSDP